MLKMTWPNTPGREVTDVEEIWDLGQVDAEADEFDVLGNKSY